MNFASDFVYVYEHPDFEYISDEEYEDGMHVSGSDSDSDEEFHDAPTESTYENVSDKVSAVESVSAPLPVLLPKPPALQIRLSKEDLPKGIPALPARQQKKGKLGKIHHWRSGIDSANALGPAPAAGLFSSVSCRHRSDHSEDHRLKPSVHHGIATGHRRVRQGDTNIVSVKFDKLISPSNMHAGDPQSCSNCGAFLSKISKLESDGDHKVWPCEFCETRNILDIVEEEIPKDNDVTFMLEPALSTTASGPSGMDESLVVFCVDVSGSMCVTTEVSGHIELKGAESLRRARQMSHERGDQYLPRQRRDVTYISRLQSVQAAIDHQLQEMVHNYPNRRAALVTFSNEVTIVGDGKTEPLSVVGDKLANKDALKSIASEQPLPDAIKNTRQQLGVKLFDLEEGGPTALGPALLISITMASKVRGSKVIVCTDGLANIGMGKLDMLKNDGEIEESVKFYDELSKSAVDNGVSISVITIKGTDCRLMELGKIADRTGGQVNIVDPLKLTQQFSTILANKIIATNVFATFIIHKELFFFYEETEESKVVRNIGNVTTDTEISFEYGVRTKKHAENEDQSTATKMEEELAKPEQPMEDTKMDTEEAKKDESELLKTMPEDDGTSLEESEQQQILEQSKEAHTPEGASASSKQESHSLKTDLPFQLQIAYTDTEGAKALRVITQTKPVTRDRKWAEKSAKLDVLAAHTAMTSAKMALEGKYTMSRERALMNQRVAWRHTRDIEGVKNKAQYKKAFSKIKTMENYLAARQKTERETVGHTYSDEEEICDEVPDDAPVVNPMEMKAIRCSAPPAVNTKSKSFFSLLRKKRSNVTEDEDAAMMYEDLQPSKNLFKESN